MAKEEEIEDAIPTQLEEWVAGNIRELREHYGWNQSEVARRMKQAGFPNYNQMLVSRTEKGERPIRVNELEGFARVFEVDLSYLLDPGPWKDFIAGMNGVERAKRILRDAIRDYLKSQAAFARQATALTNGPGESVGKDGADIALHILWCTPYEVVEEVWEEYLADEEAMKEVYQGRLQRELQQMKESREELEKYNPDSGDVTLSFNDFWLRRMNRGQHKDS